MARVSASHAGSRWFESTRAHSRYRGVVSACGLSPAVESLPLTSPMASRRADPHDERVVLSVCAVPCTTGSAHWQLIHGSLLIVPSACAETNWATWRQAERRDYGVGTGLLPASFVIDGVDWLMARSVLDLGDAETWISKVRASVDVEAPAEITLPAIADLPQLAVTLHPPTALIRVLPGIAAASGSLLSSLARPAQALLWRSPTDVQFPEPDTVTIEGTQTFLPSRDLTGIHITPPSVDPAIATPAGLLVGRAERRAWIRESCGTGDFDSFLVELGWEPARISLADLEITHEEFLDGELVSAMRIRIEDLDTSEVDGKGRCSVAVMTIGRSVTHGVSLHTADGELLDRTGPYPLAERIEATFTIDGTELPRAVIGRTDPPPLDERMRRSERMTTDLEDVIRNGVQARIIAASPDSEQPRRTNGDKFSRANGNHRSTTMCRRQPAEERMLDRSRLHESA